MEKQLMTIKHAAQLTGLSIGFFKKLLKDKRLTRYKIDAASDRSATFIDLLEFQRLAAPGIYISPQKKVEISPNPV
jgi:hypothetical protein